MAISTVNASPTGNAQTPSGYAGGGANLWSPGSTNISVSLPAGQGATWIIWQVMLPTIPAGQSFNGLVLSGINDFLVGGGGGGIVRTASPVAEIKNSLAGFSGATGTPGSPVPGSGAGVSANGTLSSALTSTDLVNGTFYVGFSADSTAADPGLGAGLFRTSALSWTIYTGNDLPVPPAGTATGYLTNPVFNTNGLIPPGQYHSVQLTVIPSNSADLGSVQWNLPGSPTVPAGSFLFAANGAATLGGSVNAGTSWLASCGLINLAANVPPGTYTMRCDVSGLSGPPGSNFSLFAQLVVLDAANGAWFMEF